MNVNGMQRPIRDKESFLQWLDRLTGEDRLYFLSYGLFLITSLLSASFFYRYFEGKPCMWLQIFCMLILVGYEYRNGFLRAQQWIPGLVLVLLTAISFRVAQGSLTRLVPMMFPYIYCSRRIPFPKIARFTLKWSIIVVSLIVFSSYLGIIDNVVMFKAGRIREFLGFRYALYLPGILLNMTLLWIYLRKSKMSLVGTLFWAVANWYAYHMSDSRISFVMAEGLLVVALLMKWLPKLVQKLRPLWAVLVPSFLFFGGAALYLTAIYDGSVNWMRRLNSSLEGRLNLGHRSLEDYRVSWFGEYIEWVGNGLDSAGNSVAEAYSYVDCMYIKILQRYGIVFTVLMAVLLTWSMYRLWKRREYHILIISAAVAAHCVLDDLSFALHYNTFWIAMGQAVFAAARLDWDGETTKIHLPPPPTS